MRALLSLLFVFVLTTAVHADPVLVPLIIGGLGSIGITVSPAIGSFISGLVLTGGLVAYTLLSRPAIPKPDDGVVTRKQSTPVRDYALGRCRKGGPLLFSEATPGGVGITIQAIQDGWTDAIENVVLHTDVVTIGEDHFVLPVDSIRYGDYTRVEYRLGRNGQTAYPWVIENFPEVYDADHRAEGITTLMVSAASPSAKTVQRTFPNGFPEGSVIGRFGRCWDPRDPAQDAGTRSTWRWSDNPFVLLLHYICFHVHGYRRRWQDVYLPNPDMWKEAMNVCDERIPLSGGGTVARYAAGGFWDAITERKAVVQEILKSCDGWLAEAGDGSWIPYAGKFYAPTDDFVLDTSNILALSLQRGVPAEDRSKAVVVTFTSPDHLYATVECDAWGEDDLEAQGVPVERSAFEVNWVHDFTQARRLAKRENGRLKAKVRGVATVDMSGLNCLRRRYVKMNWPIFASTTNAVVEIRKVSVNLQSGSVLVEFVKADPDIDQWNPATEEGQRPLVPPPANTEVNPIPPQPTLVRIGQRIQLTVPGVEEFPTAQLKAEYRKGAGDWQKMSVPDPDDLIAYTDALVDGDYEFRAYYLLGGYPGFASPSAFYSFREDAVAPPKPEKTKLVKTGTTVTVSCRAGDVPDNTWRLRFYRRPLGQVFDVATATLVMRVSARASDLREIDDTPGNGDWKYDFVAENKSGVLGPRADVVQSVTIP